MEVSLMQESRLFKIVYYLLDKGKATAPELAEKFEVSVRTIFRDIDALSGAGIPIYAETGCKGGICLMNDFVLDKAVFSEKEKQEILAALQSLSVIGNVYEDATLVKLSALFNTRSETWFEVDFSRWETKTEDNEKFETLKTAVIHHKSAEISYVSGDGQYSKRKVQPLKLYYKTNAWYLKAFCTERHDFRMFKLNRILSIKLLNEDFIPTSFPEVQKMPSQTYGKAVLRFSKEVAFRVYDEFSSSQVIRQDDGYLLVTAEMTREPWLIGGLISFGTQVEVIEPVYLKTQLAEKAKEIYEMNKS